VKRLVGWVGFCRWRLKRGFLYLVSIAQATVASCYFYRAVFNLIIAPAVYAAAEGTLERRYARLVYSACDVGAYGLLVCCCFSAGALLMSIVRDTTRAIA